jgi:outer membrane protein assembly factor BamE (lipoprotein component of BamABCDE complex)
MCILGWRDKRWACSSVISPSFVPASYTQQDIEKVSEVAVAMDKDKVEEIMGKPARVEFSASVEAWHYCRTDRAVNEYAVVIFKSGKTTQAKSYSINVPADVVRYEDCSKYIRSIFR